MDVLIIGVSSIFCRRVLPALLSLDGIGRIHLASRRPTVEIDIPEARRGRFFCGYETALRNLPPCLAYISLPNHLHGEWTRNALSAGFHVIVDKPAFLDISETDSLLALADRQQRCLAEATVWSFHPQIRIAREAFSRAGVEPRSLQAVFSFPPLPITNFRNNPDMGGGSFYDLGAYAVSPGRVFYRDDPVEVWCRILGRNGETGIDTSFALTALYPRGRVFQGFFSFGTEYRNTLSLLGPGMSITLDPVFTTSASATTSVTIRAANQTEIAKVPAADNFALFLGEVIESIGRGQWSKWTEALRQDANTLHRAADSARAANHDH